MASDHSSNQISGSSNEESRNFSEAMHRLILALLAILISLLGLRYVNSPEEPSLFRTKYCSIVAFYAALFIYIVLFAIDTKVQSLKLQYRSIISNFSFLFGALAATLLLYITIPVFGILVLTLWTVWFLLVAYKSSRESYHSVYNTETETNQRLPV